MNELTLLELNNESSIKSIIITGYTVVNKNIKIIFLIFLLFSLPANILSFIHNIFFYEKKFNLLYTIINILFSFYSFLFSIALITISLNCLKKYSLKEITILSLKKWLSFFLTFNSLILPFAILLIVLSSIISFIIFCFNIPISIYKIIFFSFVIILVLLYLFIILIKYYYSIFLCVITNNRTLRILRQSNKIYKQNTKITWKFFILSLIPALLSIGLNLIFKKNLFLIPILSILSTFYISMIIASSTIFLSKIVNMNAEIEDKNFLIKLMKNIIDK